MLSKCVNCDFYISSDEDSCPNCGLSAPSEELQKDSEYRQRDLTVIIAVAFAFVASFAVLYLRTDGRFDNFSELPVILIFSLLFGFAFSVIFSSFIAQKAARKETKERFLKSKNRATFVDMEDTITMRNFELDGKYRETENLLAQARRNGSEAIIEKLSAAREKILTQISRYELQHQKITIIRLQNSLRPLLYQQDFDAETNEKFAEEVDAAMEEIDFIRQSLTNDYAIEFPDAVQSEKRDFLAQLDETERICGRLRTTILNRQTADALRNVAPFENDQEFLNNREIARTTDVFNIQTNLTDFSEAFDRLESEYALFESKREIERRFDENV